MALFDNLSRRASAASSKAIQKTKDFSDIARLNSQISEEENHKSDSFYKMGRLYYELHANDCEEDFKVLVSSIAESDSKISDLKRQIDVLKGIRRCDRCGAELEKGAAFCSNCGVPVPKAPVVLPEGKVTCGSCGAAVTKGNRYCTACGKPIESFLSLPTEQMEEEEKGNVCPSCGAELEEDSLFCTNCGLKLAEIASVKETVDLNDQT